MAVGAIPMAEVKAYCDMKGYSIEQCEEFLYYIRIIDDEFLRLTAERKEGKK